MARKQRIDLNLLYDHNPTEFLSAVKEFIQQVNHPSYLNLFLSGLRDEVRSMSLVIFDSCLEFTNIPHYFFLPPISSHVFSC